MRLWEHQLFSMASLFSCTSANIFQRCTKIPMTSGKHKGKREHGKQKHPKKMEKQHPPKRFGPNKKKHLHCMKWWYFSCAVASDIYVVETLKESKS